MSVDRISVEFECPLINMPVRMSVDRYRRREQHFWLTALTADAALPAAVNSVAPAPRRGLPLLVLALAARRLLLRLALRPGLWPDRVLHAAEAGVRQASDGVVGIELCAPGLRY